MIKKILSIVLSISILAFILVIISIVFSNSKILINIENYINISSATTTLIGSITGIITLVATCIGVLVTLKEAQIKIKIFEEYNMEYRENNTLYLVIDKCNHLYYPYSRPEIWHIGFINSGEITIENIIIQINFDEIYFRKTLNTDYKFIDHIHGIGHYKTLEIKYENINPGITVHLPKIPFELAVIDNKKLNFLKMNLKIFINNKKLIKQEYFIKLKEPRLSRCYIEYFINEEEEQKNLNDIYCHFKFEEYKNFEIVNKMCKEKNLSIKEIYQNHLMQLESFNEEFRNDNLEKTLFWGRIYYANTYNLNISDIELLISNEINCYYNK